MIMCF